jgi:hypothetical protein
MSDTELLPKSKTEAVRRLEVFAADDEACEASQPAAAFRAPTLL